MTIIPESLDITLLQQWVGKTETHHDVINASAASALAATLDHQQSTLAAPNGAKALRPLWHWIYFWAVCGQSDVGSDGHPQRGGFLPPVPLPRRMWAGGRLTFSGPLPIGAAASRTSQIMSVTEKAAKAVVWRSLPSSMKLPSMAWLPLLKNMTLFIALWPNPARLHRHQSWHRQRRSGRAPFILIRFFYFAILR